MGDLGKPCIVRNKTTGELMSITVYDIYVIWGSRAYEMAFGRKARAQGILRNGTEFEAVNPEMLASDRNTGELGGSD